MISPTSSPPPISNTIVLLVPEKLDAERERVVETWFRMGGKVLKLGRFWQKPEELENQQVAIYGNDTFAQVLAQVLDVRLLSPDDSLLARLDRRWTKRKVRSLLLSEIADADFPTFIKPVVPKQFKARVYGSRQEFSSAIQGIPSTESILLSEIVGMEAEARAFVLEGKVQNLALYEGYADTEAGLAFL